MKEGIMIQAKFSLKKSHIQFLDQCKHYGFKDKSEVVRAALDRLSAELAHQRLRESAVLYAEIYEEDEDTMEWTDAALSEWPS
jgi:Arc/MetJ-type ribon-helix-helix transcriptional regulator